MKTVNILLFLTLFSSYTFGQTAKEKAAMNFVEKALPVGEHKFEALTKDVPEDLLEVIEVYKGNVSSHLEWYNEYLEKNKFKKPLPYHKNFGISEANYNRINNEYPNLPMKVRGVANLKINQSGDSLTFKGEGTFTMLDGLVIDTKKAVMTINEQPIPFIGEVTTLDGIGAVQGYKWKFVHNSELDALKNRQDYSLLEMNIAKAENGKTTIIFSNVYIEAGIPMINGTITGYIE